MTPPSPNKKNASREQIVDFGAIFDKYKRYWWLFLASLVLCVGLSALYLMVKKPIYLVIARVLVAQDDNASSAGASLLKSLSLGDMGGSKVDDEIVVMGSQELCTQMISKLKINRNYVEDKGFLRKKEYYNNSPVEVDAPQELFDTLSLALKFNIEVNEQGLADIEVKKGRFKTVGEAHGKPLPTTVKTPYGIFAVSKTDYYKPGKKLKIKALVSGNIPCAEGIMEDQMTVQLISKKSNGIYIDCEETNVQRGKDILNTIIALYNERGEREKNEQAINTGRFIEERLALIYDDLMGSEAEIENYKKAHNVLDAEIQTKALTTKQLEAEQEAVKLGAQRRVMQMINDFLQSPQNKNSMIPFSAEESVVSGSIKTYNDLIIKRVELSASAKDNNQVMQAIDEQLADARASVIKGVNNSIKALDIQMKSAMQVDSKSTGEMSALPSHERQMRNLYREQGIQNTLYTFLLQKKEENALLLAATTPKGKIVDHAYAKSKPVKPKKLVVLFLGLLAGLLLPMVLFYLKNMFTTKFSTQDELEGLVKAPVIGEICRNRHHQELVVQAGKSSSIVELFRLARNNIQFMMPGVDDKVLLVTSSVSGEGKSFVSANLAASFALLGKRVALVGMDIRSPRLADALKLQSVPGVTNFLSQSGVGLDDIVQKCEQVENLDVYVAGAVPPNPSELLLTEHVKTMVDQLRDRYDIVVLDSAPIAMVSDTFSLADFANVVVFVTRANYTKRKVMRYLNNVIDRGQLKNVAVVLNDSKPSMSAGYGYGYGNDDDK